MKKQLSKNLILYGPPGTGKTYQTKEIARNLLSGQTEKESKEERISKILNDLSWYDVIGLVMCGENKGFKVPELKNKELLKIYSSYCRESASPQHTIWSVLQTNSTSESSKSAYRNESNLFYKGDDYKWFLTEEGKDLFEGEEYQKILQEINNPELEQKEWKDFCYFITFHQSYSYEEFVEGIRPVLDSDGPEIKYEIKDGIFKEICKKAKNDPGNKYLLIIDEINRGNISKIFGELITLIEKNKRLGEEEEIEVKIPYSGEMFGVPMNLYIIGTMNTADRSIALLDVALRRRFDFKELMPDYSLIKNQINGLDLSKLLESLNNKIKIMIDRDHQIGHSDFMNISNENELLSVWYGKVIPLLQEYFYNDWEKLERLLGRYSAEEQKGFIEYIAKDEIRKYFGDSDAEDYSEFSPGEIHKYKEDQIVEALKNLCT